MVLVGTACGTEPAPAVAPVRPTTPERNAAPADPEADRYLAVIEQVTDYRNYAMFRLQQPPKGYRDIKRKGELPSEFASAKLYYANFDAFQSRGHAGQLHDAQLGCAASAVARDGTFCPSVVLPALDVSGEKARELIEILQRPRGAPVVIMCGGPIATHHLVLYDEQSLPVAQISIDFGCPWISRSPGRASHMNHVLSRAVRAWCRSLDLAGCDDDEPAWKRAWQRHPIRKPIRPETRGRIDKLSADDKRELCVWNTQRLDSSFRPGRGALGGQYPDGHMLWVRGLSWEAAGPARPL